MTGPRTADLWPTPDAYDDSEYERQYADWLMLDRFETVDDAAHLVDEYDGSIRQVDRHVELLLDALADHGVREETVVAVTGDHGEALGEHGIYADHTLAHPPCQRVPLVVAGEPVEPDDTVAAALIYQFDLLATLYDLFGVDVPTGLDAESFYPALEGTLIDGREHLVCGHGIYTFSRAVYADDWVYVRLLHPGVFSHPQLFNRGGDGPAAGLALLHDLSSDPFMTENLVGDRPEVVAELRAVLDDWHQSVLLTDDAAGTDPLARMAVESGPFLYVDPGELVTHYRQQGRSAEQIAIVERARDVPRIRS